MSCNFDSSPKIMQVANLTLKACILHKREKMILSIWLFAWAKRVVVQKLTCVSKLRKCSPYIPLILNPLK